VASASFTPPPPPPGYFFEHFLLSVNYREKTILGPCNMLLR